MDWLVCVVVIFDMLNTIFRDMIRLISNEKAKVALAALVLQFMVMFGIICAIDRIIGRENEPNITPGEKGIKALIAHLQTVAVCCYFLGDNFYYIMNRYGGCLPWCGQTCIKYSYYAAVGVSSTAAIAYATVKVLQLAIKDNSERNKKKEEWTNFLPMIAVIAEMDLIYTIASSKLSGTGEEVASFILLVMAIAIGVAILFGKARKLWKKIYEWNDPIQSVPIRDWITKLNRNQTQDIGQWNIKLYDIWRSLPDELNDNDFILTKGDGNNSPETHNNIVNNLRLNLTYLQYHLAEYQRVKDENLVDELDNYKRRLRDALTSLRDVDQQAPEITYTKYRRTVIGAFIVIAIPLIFHTLGDNLEPLDSINGIKCIPPNFCIPTNTTVHCQSEESCETNSIVRLCLAFVSLILVLFPAVYCFYYWLNGFENWRQRLCGALTGRGGGGQPPARQSIFNSYIEMLFKLDSFT